jgi:hypothetical protein
LDDHAFPLRVSESRYHLEDSLGRPFLLHGDTMWSLIVGGPLEDARRYLDDRAAKGFSAVIVNLIESHFSPDPPRTTDGIEPFLVPGDFRTLNPAYVQRAHAIVAAARERGIVIMLVPAYLGYRAPNHPGWVGPEGWYTEVLANGVETLGAYGRAVGEAFADLDNVIWVLLGDRNPGEAAPHMEAMAAGLRAGDPSKLFTAHAHPGAKPLDFFPWLDLNQTYSYGIVHRRVLEDHLSEPRRPNVLFESSYENEHYDSSPVQFRRQSWWALLSGACGQFYGNNPVWGAFDGWQDALDLPGTLEQVHVGSFFRGLSWWLLRPDADRRFLVAGHGEANGLDRCTAAVATDGSFAVAYMPSARQVVLDLTALAEGRYEVRWFNPRGGDWHNAGTYQAAGRWPFVPPDEEDWALLLARHVADSRGDR